MATLKTRSAIGIAAACVATACFALVSANAQMLDQEVKNKKYSATVELPGGFEADLTVSFDHPTGLTTSSLGVTAKLVDPTDMALMARLQSAGLVSIPTGFPVMITIEPPANGGLSFEGLTKIEIYTKNLHYTAGSPLRLFSAHQGGDFHDITDLIAGGSYRTRGSKGDYSDFLIIVDARPLSQVIGVKFDRIEDALLDNSAIIGPTLGASLSSKLTTARNAWLSGQYDDAIDAIETFDEAVSDAGGAGQIPNEWLASGGTENIAGEIRAAARTLRFSLTLGANNL